jgi:hypothetical protein
LAATRTAQADLAREFGVEAFLYWHYWFGAGKTILERPFDEVLTSGAPALSFALAFANQTWTGAWHGAPDRILLEQQYLGAEDEQAHFDHILPAFSDARYLRVDGKPLFYVFRPELMPDAALFVDRWQSMALAAGLPGLYLVAEIGAMLGRGVRYSKAEPDGFDAAVYVRLPARASRTDVLRMRTGRKLFKFPEIYPYDPEPTQLPPYLDPSFVHPNVFPNWDNTPRAGRKGVALTGSTPSKFEGHVRAAVKGLAIRRPQERLLFVKSWNEWAEGNHLEPDLEYGRAWLEALRNGLRK